MAFAADLMQRVNTIALARWGAPVSVNGTSVQADFCKPGVTGYLGGVSAEATAPQIILLTADVPANPRGKSVVVGADTYTIVEHKPDGFGLSTLLLEPAA